MVLTGQPNYPSGRFFPGHGFLGPAREQHLGIEIVRVPLLPRGAGGAVRLFLNYLSFVLFAVMLGLPRLRGRFDACIAFCPSPITSAIPAIVLRRFRKTPVALWLQDLWPETFFAVTKSRSRVLRALLDWMVSRIHAGVDQIWIQSRGYAESVRAHGGRAEQIRYVPNWAEDLYNCDGWTDLAAESVPPNSARLRRQSRARAGHLKPCWRRLKSPRDADAARRIGSLSATAVCARGSNPRFNAAG